ncbi:sensor histidine kinase [Intestinibacter bartlettii]|uniref:sensor histidine kinase n=1 Tax=Intestinibacter bartlettii TaxID=261299 RepID=UPI00242CE2C9|nr:HAMP domain-containing sensor histidine kinase [Intestinibacter bartlettii]MDU6822434.1 HAMP domain-containing sensor histidine kinase [Intestinibacter bartlettii]
MKKMKLFQKTYLFTVGLMAIIIIISHTLLYMLLPSFYTNKKQQDLDNISYQLTEQLQNNNSNKSDEIAKKFADMHNINILLSVNGKNKVYEGIKSCDIYINPDALDEQSLVIDNKTDFIEDNKKSNSTEVKNDFLKISDSSLLYTKKLKTKDNVDASIKVAMDLQYLQEARSVVFMILPYSIGISLIISLFASYIYTKKITKPIKQICDVTKEMQVLKEDAYCDINTGDEIELLATNINSLYKNLLDTIDSLKEEIENVSKSEKSKVDFLRSASHELKTPLMSIHIMLENMILNIGKYKNHDVYLPKCQEAVVNLSSMVQEILDTSRLNSLNGETELKEVDLKILIESIIEPYKIIAKSKKINMNIDYSNSLNINTDKSMLKKALSNIISNAVNYTDNGKNINIYFEKNSLIIENECKPIEQNHLDHIFEAFYRAEFDRNKNTGGNGLGLYIVQQILKTLNISHSFESVQNGMKFTINFEENNLIC